MFPPGWDASQSQGAQHEETRSITAPSGWDTSPSQNAEVTRSITAPYSGFTPSILLGFWSNSCWYPFIHLGQERQYGVKFFVFKRNNTTAETRLE